MPPPSGGGEAADEDDLADLTGAGVGGEPRQAAGSGMPHHHGPPGRRIDGRDHRGHLIGERRGRIAVALAWQGDRHGAVAASLELGGDVVPDRRVEPQASDQHDVHLSSPSRCGAVAPDVLERILPAPTIDADSGRSAS